MIVSIHYLLIKYKRGPCEALLKIRRIRKREKTRSFYVHKQRNLKCYLHKNISLTTQLEYLNYFFLKSNQNLLSYTKKINIL